MQFYCLGIWDQAFSFLLITNQINIKTQQITGHGVNWDNTGYQCQKCGKFHEIENERNKSKRKKCEYGGKLGRDKPIFYPECKTTNVSYQLIIIT